MIKFEIIIAGGNKQGGVTVEFIGTLAAAKKVIQAEMVKYGNGDAIRTKYAHARVYFGDDVAECSLTATHRLRFNVQERRVVKAPVVYGTFVEVVSVHGKYCDSMGAYEVLTVLDEKGQEYSVGNMYDTTACFRTMTKEQRLAYAQASV
jgi:hypothetical protein